MLDGIEAATGRRDLLAGADAAVALGLVGALGAAVTGTTDFHKSTSRARRIGVVHGLANLGATGLYAASWLLRRSGRRGSARGLAWMGCAATAASAYLGGILVYNEKVGVDHTDRAELPDDFVTVLPLEDLPNERPVRVMASGKKVMLVRHEGRIYALAETCAHLGGPLAEGKLEGGSIRCPWHGSRYSLADGRVIEGPSAYPQPCFEVRVRGGQIEVRAARSSLEPAPKEA